MSCLCPDVWNVIASFMPPDGKGEGYYRLARVCKSILLPVLLEKGKREVRQRLLSQRPRLRKSGATGSVTAEDAGSLSTFYYAFAVRCCRHGMSQVSMGS